jgi:hypothetical protein
VCKKIEKSMLSENKIKRGNLAFSHWLQEQSFYRIHKGIFARPAATLRLKMKSDAYEAYVSPADTFHSDHDSSPPPAARTSNSLVQNITSWGLALITGVCVAVTIVYSCAITSKTGTFGSLVPSVVDATVATRALRILSEGVTILLTALVGTSASIVVWAAANRKRGIMLSTWLGMSASTSWMGLWNLFWWESRRRRSMDYHRFWIVMR